ncbi:MAG: WecB/TagA/CpsF family glycosyltransferase [Pseudomonadota bacterium]
MNQTVDILGVSLTNLDRAALFAQLTDGVFFSPNVDVIMKLRDDPEFFDLFHQAEFRICDSQIVQLGSRFLGTPIKERISGSDFLGEYCLHHRDDPEVRIFLLGAGPGVALEAQRRINARIGRDIVIAAHSPSFGFEKKPEECAALAALVNGSGATVLAVGVGAPKQEKFIMGYKQQMPAIRVFMAVGATIDFEAGNMPRAPAWMSRSGLEWAFRLGREPKRLWKRYLVDDLPFFWLLLKQRLGLLKPLHRRR